MAKETSLPKVSMTVAAEHLCVAFLNRLGLTVGTTLRYSVAIAGAFLLRPLLLALELNPLHAA